MEQRPYTESKSYIALCDALMDYLKSDLIDKDEKKQVLAHAKEIFEHFCLTESKPKLYTWSNEMQRTIQ